MAKILNGTINAFLSSIQDTRLTYAIVLTGSTFLAIFHLLPKNIKTQIRTFAKNPVILSILLAIILIIGYFNIFGGIILLLLFTVILLSSEQTQDNTEGFTNPDDYDKLTTNNKVIKDLFKPGKLRQELEAAKKTNKDIFSAEMANNKFMEYEVNKQRKKAKKQQGSDSAEKFSDSSPIEIEQRKFNPANEEDVNLLTTMEICDDIRDRIKYSYEEKKYLKRYIKEKLEEIVDLLDLVSD